MHHIQKGLVVLIFSLATLSIGSPLQEKPLMPKRVVMISDFSVKLGTPVTGPKISVGGSYGNSNASSVSQDGAISISNVTEFSQGLTEMMTTALIESKVFRVIEPSQEGEEQPIKPMFFIRSSITEMTCRFRSGTGSIGGLFGGQGSYENKIVLDTKLVDPETFEVLESVRSEGKKSAKSSIFGAEKYVGGSIWSPGTKVLDLTFSDYATSPLYDATRLSVNDAIKKLVEKLNKRTWEARVIAADLTEDNVEIYLDLDGESGITLGTILELYRLGEQIVDEKTNKPIGRKKSLLLGTVKVTGVEEESVRCEVIGETAEPIIGAIDRLVVRLKKQ